MNTIWYRCLLVVLAAALGGSTLGCDQDDEWEHPNRERYPAPPVEERTTRSIEELQRDWKEEEQRAQQNQTLQQERPQEQQEDPTQTAIDDAAHYIREALEAAMSDFGTPPAPEGEGEAGEPAVGGGPSQGSSAAPSQQDPGDM